MAGKILINDIASTVLVSHRHHKHDQTSSTLGHWGKIFTAKSFSTKIFDALYGRIFLRVDAHFRAWLKDDYNDIVCYETKNWNEIQSALSQPPHQPYHITRSLRKSFIWIWNIFLGTVWYFDWSVCWRMIMLEWLDVFWSLWPLSPLSRHKCCERQNLIQSRSLPNLEGRLDKVFIGFK